MNKKLVGIIITVIILVGILVAVVIGGMRLQKSDGNDNGEQQRASEQRTETRVESVTTEDTVKKQPPQNNNRKRENPNSINEENNVNTNEDLTSNDFKGNEEQTKSEVTANDIINNSEKIEDLNLPEGSIGYTPTDDTLGTENYELQGVVEDVQLLSSTNGLQAQHKVTIEIDLGQNTTYLDYFTTVSSLEALKVGTKVSIKYLVTEDDKNIVIKGVSLID